MSAQIPSHNDWTADLVQRLKSHDRWERERAAKKLGELGVKTDAIVHALTEVATNDRNPYPRRAARTALSNLGLTAPPSREGIFSPKAYTTTREKYIDFAYGFIGWFAIFGVIALYPFSTTTPCDPAHGPCGQGVGYSACLCIPVHVMLTIFLLSNRRWAGYGVLVAYTSNLATSVLLNLAPNAFLGMPFFISIPNY